MKILNNPVNDFEKFDIGFLELCELKNKNDILSYIDKNVRYSFFQKEKGNTCFIYASDFDGIKNYSFIFLNNKLIASFKNKKVFLLDEYNILLTDIEKIEHYKIKESTNEVRLANSFPNEFKKVDIRSYGENIILNGKLYSPSHSCFSSPTFDEIITLNDYENEKSIIYDESVCPKELRKAIQDLVKKSNVDIGIKEIRADDQLLSIDGDEYLKTLSIFPIIKNCYDFTEFFYYDPMTKKIVKVKPIREQNFIEVPKIRLNIITDVINQQRASEFENGLYVDAISTISSSFPITNKCQAKEIVEPILSKKYYPKKEQK